MKTPRFLLLILTALFAVLTPRPAEARTEVSFDFFYDSLTPYGEWVQVADYGFCWRPTDVDPDWTPYSDGYWAYTDAGWTWVSYEDFGGIVYHYGRWVRVEDEGWCWTPDYEWGPAWVSWRHSDDYVGWAPLPPECRWQPSTGISIWVDRDYDIGPSYYSFCHVRDFGAPVLRPVIINRIENITIIRRTVNITNITYNTHYSGGPIIYNGGPSFVSINQRSSRRIPALKLVQNVNIDLSGMRDTPRGDRRRNFNGQAVGNQLVVTAPFVKPLADPGFLKPQVKKVIAADKVSRGWNGVKNDDVRKELKQEMQRQTKGLTRETAPAKAVAVNDLKVLPAKADPQAPSPLATRDRGDRPDKNDKNDKDGPDKKGKTPAVAGPTSGPADGTDGRTKPGPQPVTTPNSDDKTTPGKPRGPVARDGQKPGEPGLKPFNPVNPVNPVAETDPQPPKGKGKDKDKSSGAPGTGTTPEPRVAKPGPDATKMRDAEQQQQQQQQRQAEMIRQRQEQQKAAQAEQDKTRKQGEAAARMQQQQDAQREALRLQQKEKDDGARQRMQADQQERSNRQQAAAAAQQQKQAEMQRRQADDQKAADQQARRAAMEQQRQQKEAGDQQRQQKEANEQARRNQDAQRDQMRQQAEAQRQAREAQRAQQQQQQNNPPAGSSDSEDPRKKRKKD